MPAIGSSSSQNFGFQGQGSSEFYSFAHTVRQGADRFLADRLYFKEINNIFNHFTMPDLFLMSRTEVQKRCSKILFHQYVSGRHEIVQSTQAAVQFNVLKCACQTQLGGFIRPNSRNAVSFKINLTLAGL